MQIEELGPRHLESLTRFFAEIVSNGDDAVFHPHPLTSSEASRLCNSLSLDQYFVAISGGEISAYGMLRGWDEGFAEPSLGIAVRPGARKKGHGKLLAEFLLEQARYRGAESIRLTVYAENFAACGLFARLGFAYEPHSQGRLLGRLNLKVCGNASPLRVGICADMLIGWGGGIDLAVNLICAMRAADTASTLYLLAPGPPPDQPRSIWGTVSYQLKDAVKQLIGRPRLAERPELTRARRIHEMTDRLRKRGVEIALRYSAGLDEDLRQTISELSLDAVFLAMRPPASRPDCALIGYVPDYQHHHLPHLFSADEICLRDKMSARLIAVSDAMIMNAKAVADDMERLAGPALPSLHPLPFSPTTDSEWLQNRPEILSAYGIRKPYFIVCNQFWAHKDHLTAFRAMAGLSSQHPEVSLICTGSPVDYRDSSYFARLKSEVSNLKIDSRVLFLGHIPKRDQIELLKHATALVQPTLFEGGPGGGSAFEAIALGQRVLASDLPVNLEIDGGDVRFFRAGDAANLAQIMGSCLSEQPVARNTDALLARSDARLRRNGEAIWRCIRDAFVSYQKSRRAEIS